MTSSLAAQFRALWHELTSNDRHASHNSPFRTGNHVALPQNRHSPLTSVATTALESRVDLEAQDAEADHGFVSSKNGAMSPSTPYSPGMRKTLQRQSSGMDAKMEGVATGEIQMQNFNDGLPPPPPVSHSWKRIDRWLEDNYEELFENVGLGATVNDINELEHELDCTLPNDVRDSLQAHDGQERGGMPTGVIFGCMLMDCEEIVQEWQNWRTVNEVYFGENASYEIPQAPIKAFAGSSTSIPIAQSSQAADPQWRQELMERQDSQPTNAIQKVYSHPGWIPLARDWGGNNICVDLAPGATGKWGQVILTGRDYDCKYVISRSWAAFLATVADDMSTDKPFIDEDSKELKLREFKQTGVEPAYIDILRWRTDQKYGRKAPKKRSLRINSQIAGHQANGFSPYTSPGSNSGDERGRSPHRPSNGKAPATTAAPRGILSSPLARVNEESSAPQPLAVDTAVEPAKPEKLIPADTPKLSGGPRFDRLVPVDTPIAGGSEEAGQPTKQRLVSIVQDNDDGPTVNDAVAAAAAAEAQQRTGSIHHRVQSTGGEMKDVQI